MELDKTGLLDRTFEIPSLTNARSYSFLCNMETNVSRWSKNAVEYFGLPGEYMYDVSSLWEQHVHPDDRAEYLRGHDALWSGEKEWSDFEYRARNKDGDYVLCTCRCVVLKGADGEPDLFTGTIVNHGIHDAIDPVTNLHSGQEFILKLRQMIQDKAQAAVMKIAINVFNHFNVMYGYECGDAVLKAFGDALRASVFGQGYVYRLDGAKFALILENVDNEAEVRNIFDKVKQLAKSDIKIGGLAAPLTISGSAMLLDHYEGTDVSVKSCLSYALSQSKHEQHGELVFFREKDGEDGRNLEMLGAIHRSILDGCRGFYLCYQPLVSVETEQIVGAEALIRWRQEPYGDVPPGRFIPWLETDPVFYSLGNWIIRNALSDMMRVKQKNPDFILNVNVAASQLEREEFREDVLRALKDTGFPPGDLFMELTERCKNLDYEFLREEMDFFHRHGIRLSLDDFGTGSSSLSLLKELPIDELKVDMSFIRNIESNPKDQSLVKFMVLAANDMGVKTCLEGVETQSISRYLKQHAATYYQGYYYSRPVRIEEFEQLVEQDGKAV